MTSSLIGLRYAKALAEIVLEPNSPVKPAEAVAQIKTVEAMIATMPELRAVFATPAIQTSRKKAVMSRLAGSAAISSLVQNFLGVVISHKRIGQLSDIRASLEKVIDEQTGYVRALVTSAAPLDPAQSKTIEAELIRISGKQIRMETAVDPDLLGGVTARIGSTLYDGSLRGQIETMRRKLTSEAEFKVGI
jgi:F-type H+-transporting ATPase subunit delta